MKQFYNVFSNQKVSTMWTQLSWSHIRLLFSFDVLAINYYIQIVIDNNISLRELYVRIKNNEYERLPEETKNRIINKEKYSVMDFVKNLIVIKNKYNTSDISEKVLQQLILEDIELFMNELGNNFSYIGSEYKIKIEGRYNYIDLLLFNNCYVVIELKVTELKKEYIGQIQVYMNYIDSNLKRINHDKTIGIIICKRNNRYIIEYCSDKRIISREYNLI